MGSGFSLKCKCGEHEVWLGAGMYLNFEGNLKAARNGDYGVELQKRTEGKQYIRINDLFLDLYYCKECGYWKVDTPHDLYEPVSIEDIRKLNRQRKIEEEIEKAIERGENPQMQDIEYPKFRLAFRYKHICPKCRKELVIPDKINDSLISKLRCQKCGGKMKKGNKMILWD